MFGSVAAAGIRILGQTAMDRRSVLIIAASFGVGLGVAAQPTLLDQMPAVVKTLFDSAITSGGITAILLNLLLPEARCRSGAGQREGRRPGALAQAAGLIRAFANFSAPGLCPAAGLGYQRGITPMETCA